MRNRGRILGLGIFLLFAVLMPLQAQAPSPGTINTIGGGAPNNVSALSASVEGEFVVKDGSGNFYASSPDFGMVFKVTPSGKLFTFAGNSSFGYTGDGGLATSAQLECPAGLAIDTAGDLFISDFCSGVIREVAASTGKITTVAGNGTQGYLGDGGVATNAELNEPSDVSVDAGGNLFISDFGNNVIREVVCATKSGSCTAPSGKTVGDIYTVAGNGTAGYTGDGGSATSAELNGPFAVALDSAGNLLAADSGNSVIRRIACAAGASGCTPPTGETAGDIYTTAGDGNFGYSGDGGAATSAELNYPNGVWADSSDDIFIADSLNNVIREVSNGNINTIAGSGTAGFGGDGGPALSSELNFPVGITVDATGHIFIGDTQNNRVREVSGGVINTVSGNGFPSYSGDGGAATNAQFAFPFSFSVGVTADTLGNLWVADSGNNVVREISSSSGNIGTVAGNGTAGYSGDAGPATSATFDSPSGAASDISGNLFIADTFNNVIREVAASTGIVTTIVGNGTAGYSGDGGPASKATLNLPSGLFIDNAGNIYFADTNNNVVREVVCGTGASSCVAPKGETDGDIYTIAGNGTAGYTGDGGPATSATLNFPYGVAVDGSGNIFIADSLNNAIREVKVSTGKITTVAGNGSAGYTGDGGPAVGAMLNGPYAVSVDTVGDLFISDTSNNVLREVVCATAATGCAAPSGKSAGDIYTVAGNGTRGFSGDGGAATSAKIGSPEGVAIDGYGNVEFADDYANRVRRVSAIAMEASASLSAASVGFTPAQVIGASAASQTITLSDPGTSPLTVSGIALSGDSDFTTSNNCGTLPATVNAGANCTITVKFQAATTGPRAATLTLSDNATNSPQVIPITGAGINFSIGTSTGGSTSATVAPGQTATYSLALSATGGFTPNDQLSVSLSCSGAPKNTTCYVPSSAVNVTPAKPGAFTISVDTTGSGSLPPDFLPTPSGPLGIVPLAMGLLASCLFVVWLRTRTLHPGVSPRRRKAWLALAVPSALLAVSLVALAGCGVTGNGKATKAGTYTLTVTGTASGVSHTIQLTLKVT